MDRSKKLLHCVCVVGSSYSYDVEVPQKGRSHARFLGVQFNGKPLRLSSMVGGAGWRECGMNGGLKKMVFSPRAFDPEQAASP
jgi:hypothetical protein